jgi:hypothetical protein
MGKVAPVRTVQILLPWVGHDRRGRISVETRFSQRIIINRGITPYPVFRPRLLDSEVGTALVNKPVPDC